jgi:antitoxin component YwqK of YwqJK toxin-antitoxin module
MSDLILRETPYKNGGQILGKGFYRGEKPEGEYRYWYHNGQLWIRRFYRDGKPEGECTFWHENGRVESKIFYRNGKREGECRSWNKNGRLFDRHYYQNGIRVDTYFANEYLESDFYSRNNVEVIDNLFTWKKKHNILRIKYLLKRRLFGDINSFLISDLESIVV